MPSIKFVDYTFSIMDTGDIVFDSELKPKQLHVEHGDKFEVILIDVQSYSRKLSNERSVCIHRAAMVNELTYRKL